MVEWISSWVQQIIIAVIISTIIEIIIPKGNNSKYIKTMIGIYIMFTILSPFIELFTKQNISFASYDYDEYFTNTEEYKTLESKISTTEYDNLEETYILKLKQDIENKLNKKGYIVSSIKLDVELENEEEYGQVRNINLSVSKNNYNVENDESIKNSNININKIKIGDNVDNNTSTEKKITDLEKEDIKNFLIEEYGIEDNNITINNE